MTTRFDYVKYDDVANNAQAEFKDAFLKLEKMAVERLDSPRAKALVMTKLEEAYMWVGKAIRDDQISRNGSAEEQPERCDDSNLHQKFDDAHSKALGTV